MFSRRLHRHVRGNSGWILPEPLVLTDCELALPPERPSAKWVGRFFQCGDSAGLRITFFRVTFFSTLAHFFAARLSLQLSTSSELPAACSPLHSRHGRDRAHGGPSPSREPKAVEARACS